MKRILFAAMMLLASTATFAQWEAGTFSIQPKVGVNIANGTGEDAKNFDSRIGLAIGAEAQYMLTDMIGISGGLIYSQQGAKLEGITFANGGVISIDGVKTTAKLDYLNVPILANVYIVPGLAVKLGLQPGFLLSSKEETKIKDVSHTEDISNIEKFDLSLPIGVSYEFHNFVIDGRYNFGLTKPMKDLKAYNSVFQVTLGYRFHF